MPSIWFLLKKLTRWKGSLRVRAIDSHRSPKGQAHRSCQGLEEGQSRHPHVQVCPQEHLAGFKYLTPGLRCSETEWVPNTHVTRKWLPYHLASHLKEVNENSVSPGILICGQRLLPSCPQRLSMSTVPFLLVHTQKGPSVRLVKSWGHSNQQNACLAGWDAGSDPQHGPAQSNNKSSVTGAKESATTGNCCQSGRF